MNPFSLNKSQSGISITCTNVRGLGCSTKDLADKKINRILNLKADIHILIDTRCSEAQFNHFMNSSKFKYLLSNFQHFGSYTKSKGIIVLHNKKKCKIDKIELLKEGMLISFNVSVQNEVIKILGCYAPSSGDEPEYFVECKDILDNSPENHGLMLGDLNTTLDPNLDRRYYKHDNHIKSRLVINSWIEANEILDFYRLLNGNTQAWTYRTKETHNKTLKSRLDYVLGTPSLCYSISNVTHVFHEYDITDHASTYFSIDFQPKNEGPGVFRAHPSLLQNKEYISIINNLILRTIIDDLKDQTDPIIVDWKKILFEKETLEHKKNISYIWNLPTVGQLQRPLSKLKPNF